MTELTAEQVYEYVKRAEACGVKFVHSMLRDEIVRSLEAGEWSPFVLRAVALLELLELHGLSVRGNPNLYPEPDQRFVAWCSKLTNGLCEYGSNPLEAAVLALEAAKKAEAK